MNFSLNSNNYNVNSHKYNMNKYALQILPSFTIKNYSYKVRHNSFDTFNNNNINKLCPPLQVPVTQGSPRVPEIQMINKFYGLIPKKFIINSRPPRPQHQWSR